MISALLLVLTATPHVAARHSPPSSIAVPRRGFVTPIAAFGNPRYFTDKLVQSDRPDVKLKVPNFDAVFDVIRKVSPLSKQAMTQESPGGIAAITAIDDVAANFYSGSDDPDMNLYQWKVLDSNPNRLVSRIDAIDNFMGKGVPLQRLRSTLRGPAKQQGFCFSELVSEVELRTKWDATCSLVDTIYAADDLHEIQELQKNKYGEAQRFGVGFVKTKRSIVSPREQLTLCGLQKFPSGATITWGIELEEDQNYLFPGTHPERVPRSTSHLFVMTTIPRNDDPTTFDVEYVIQVEVGGIPGWLTAPLIIDAVKKMFRFAEGYFESGFVDGGDLTKRLALLPDDTGAVEDAGEIGADGDGEAEGGTTTNATNTLDEEQAAAAPPIGAAEEEGEIGTGTDGEVERLDEEKTVGMPPAGGSDQVATDEIEKLKELVALYESDRMSFRKSAKLAAKAAKEKISTKTKRLLGRNSKKLR